MYGDRVGLCMEAYPGLHHRPPPVLLGRDHSGTPPVTSVRGFPLLASCQIVGGPGHGCSLVACTAPHAATSTMAQI